ncbi:MAG: DUF4347 domain-containing protein [Chitinophagales bacterium]
MQYFTKTGLKFFFNCILLWSIMVFSHTLTISATESRLWIEDNILEKSNIEIAFANQKSEGLHIFAHGRMGKILLNEEWYNTKQFAQWLLQNDLVEQEKQVYIYACNFAKGKKGKAAIEYLEKNLGICIAASDDVTGVDGDWELEVGNRSNHLVVANYSYNLQCTNPIPTATAYVLAASCTNETPNDDAYFQISTATNATHYNFIAGSDYSTGDADIANATAFDVSTDLPLQFGTLANPSSSQDYTIRIFNTESDCYTDITVTLMEQECTVGCSCIDYVYLNDPQDDVNGFIHKFSINVDGTLTEIDGDPNTVGTQNWFPAGGGLPSPHGLATDLNGYLYIAETSSGDIRRLTCEGNMSDELDFVINDGGYNFRSYENILYVNSRNPNEIRAYDLCDGSLLGYIELDGADTDDLLDWGFEIAADGTFYATAGWNDYDGSKDSHIYRFTPTLADFVAHTSYSAFITETSFPNEITDNNDVWGITTDNAGNMYVVMAHYGASFTPPYETWILKFDNTGALVDQAFEVDDQVDGGTGYFGSRGIVYYEPLNILYIAGFDDCVAIVDAATLDYIGAAAGYVPNQAPKGVALLKECCPTPNRQTINETYCVSGSNEQLFLNELFPCDGVVCEGQWIPADAAAAAIYNDCNQSISAGIAPGCYSFTKGSDGLESFPKCGAFELNFNLEIIAAPELTVSADETVCNGETTTLSITTTATDIQWQMSTISCTEGFTDIDGATSTTYTTTTLSNTTYYRVVANATGDCNVGTCPFESDCMTINVDGPTLTIDGATCDAGDTTYTIDFTSDVIVTSTAGTVAGNQVIDIPVGTDVTITAELNSCTIQNNVVSPDCESNCEAQKCIEVIVTKIE